MIICILGDVGSGKTVSAIRYIVKNNKKAMVNFSCRIPNTHRLKITDIITERVERVTRNGNEIKKKSLNWDYWNELVQKRTDFDIYLDEVHNIIHSRQSMSKVNVLLSMWISQIRKILGSSEKNNIYLISQKFSRIDIAFRDLVDTIILCKKITTDEKIMTRVREHGRTRLKLLPKTYIIQYHFSGDFVQDRFTAWLHSNNRKLYEYRIMYLANDYYQFYDSYEFIRFGESVYL